MKFTQDESEIKYKNMFKAKECSDEAKETNIEGYHMVPCWLY